VKELAPSGFYNLGVAHGVPGVIGFLAQVATLELDKETKRTASELLAGSMKWLLAQKRPPDLISRYCSWTIPGQDGGDSRLGWCYGDLGIASVIQFAAQYTQNPIWMTEARILIDRCARRELNIDVFDASLCHGAFGNAHIFNRAFQTDHEEVYKQTALNWIRKGLSLRKPGVGIAGYFAWRPDAVPHEQADTAFLSGAVGVALALLSAIAPIEPKWDRIMLLSGVEQTLK
jgi:class I lanthipeptide synthase